MPIEHGRLARPDIPTRQCTLCTSGAQWTWIISCTAFPIAPIVVAFVQLFDNAHDAVSLSIIHVAEGPEGCWCSRFIHMYRSLDTKLDSFS